MSNAKNIFSQGEQDTIINAIKEAETHTSGEIRVHVENRCKMTPMERASQLFHALHMDETGARNGVLIYLAVKDRQFSIFGDEGINKVVPDNFWDEIKDQMEKAFKDGAFVKGVTYAIKSLGDELKQYFPFQSNDENELPDEISFSDE